MAHQPTGSISALGAFRLRADMGPLGLICHAIWILACTCIIAYTCVSHAIMKRFILDFNGDLLLMCRFVKLPVVYIVQTERERERERERQTDRQIVRQTDRKKEKTD
jgi:hypothetical protein